MEFFGQIIRRNIKIFLRLYAQLWHFHYFNDHSYPVNLIPLNAKANGLDERNAEDPTFNERGTRKI
jgi:hypothetical protein